MTYKTILVHCDASPAVPHRLGVAVELAKRFGGHIVGLHTRQPFTPSAFFDAGMQMDSLYAAYEEEIRADQTNARVAFDKAVNGKDVSSEWRSVEGFADNELILYARYADLVVLGQSNPGETQGAGPPSALPEVVALSTSRAVLVVPHIGVKKPPGKTVMVCWNAGREAARATSDALPFLKAAGKVIVLVVDPSRAAGHGAEPGADVAAWLSRHGVKVTVQRDTAVDGDVAATILSRAADHDVDLVVMGVYGHSRVREFVLGGASRTILGSMTVPVLMTH